MNDPVKAEVIPFSGNDRLPVTRNDLSALQEKRDVLREFVKSQLKEGIDNDFAKIPGTNKKTLLKPGAEKLMQLFGLGSSLTRTLYEIDRNGNFAMIAYKCEVFHLRTGAKICECEGMANSQEKKYATEGKWEKGPNGKDVKNQVEKPVYDVINTLMKMAQKRALVGAVIQATAAGDFFTQDMEDSVSPANGAKNDSVNPPPQNNGATSRIQITGDTVPVKDRIKSMGGRWDANGKFWYIDAATPEQLQELQKLEGIEIK
jgi:hypothetical protein